jgi:hypothetical protein
MKFKIYITKSVINRAGLSDIRDFSVTVEVTLSEDSHRVLSEMERPQPRLFESRKLSGRVSRV